MIYSIAPLEYWADWVLLVARVIAGVTMIYYGWPKIKDLRANAKDFVKMGFRPGMFWGTIAAFTEFFGGLMLILGIYVWLPAVAFGVQMIIGTIWKITKTDKPFTDWSYDLLLLAIVLLILAFGSGQFALVG